MNREEFSLLMAKKLAGEASVEEIKELERIMQSGNDFAARHNLLQRYWNSHENENASDVESSLKKLLARMETPVVPVRKHRTKRLYFAAAASVLVIVSLSFMFYLYRPARILHDPKQGEVVMLEKINPVGTKSILTLNDGTRIWLNAESRFSYPDTFTGNTREVHLSGEAFFDVAKDAARPFIIHLTNGTVKVLGTSFNVRAYENENKIETTVATGKVAFIPKYSDSRKKLDTLFLTPDRKLSYVFTAEELLIAPSAADEDKAWTEGKLVFKSDTWEDIALDLERNFGKKLVFEDDRIRKYKLTGSFQNNSLEEILFYLSKTTDFNYEIGQNEVKIFYSRNNRP